MDTFIAKTNGRYRTNLSDPYRAYSNKRVIVHWWNSTQAMITRKGEKPTIVSRNHLVID